MATAVIEYDDETEEEVEPDRPCVECGAETDDPSDPHEPGYLFTDGTAMCASCTHNACGPAGEVSRAMSKSDKIEKVEGVITFVDGKTANFMLSDEGIQRWGASTAILGRGVDVTELMQKALVDEGAYSPEDQIGQIGRFEFTAIKLDGTDAATIEVHAVLCAPYADFGMDEPWWRLDISDVSDVLDAWVNADNTHRSWRWPDTEAADDPAVIAFVGHDGSLYMDEWSAVDDNEYDLSYVLDPKLLPEHQYRIERIES